jgi:hypothetical protein
MLRSGPLNDDVEQVLGPQSRAVMIVVYSATHGCVALSFPSGQYMNDTTLALPKYDSASCGCCSSLTHALVSVLVCCVCVSFVSFNPFLLVARTTAVVRTGTGTLHSIETLSILRTQHTTAHKPSRTSGQTIIIN